MDGAIPGVGSTIFITDYLMEYSIRGVELVLECYQNIGLADFTASIEWAVFTASLILSLASYNRLLLPLLIGLLRSLMRLPKSMSYHYYY